MKNNTPSAVYLFVIVLFLTAGTERIRTQAADDSVGEKIISILTGYDVAWNRKDVESVGKILAPNYTYFSSTGGIMKREQTLEFLISPKYVLRSAKRTEIFPVISENTVIVGSRWIGNGTYNDEAFNDDQRCSLVFTRQKQEWKLLLEHCTQIVSKP